MRRTLSLLGVLLLALPAHAQFSGGGAGSVAPATPSTAGTVKVPTTGGLLVGSDASLAVSNQAVWTLVESSIRSLPNTPGQPGEFWNNGIVCRVPGTFVAVGTTNAAQIFLNTLLGSLPTTSSTPGAWINNGGGGCITRVPGTYTLPSATVQDVNAILNYAPLSPTRPLSVYVDGGLAIYPLPTVSGGSGTSASAVGTGGSFQTALDGSGAFGAVPDFNGELSINHSSGNARIKANPEIWGAANANNGHSLTPITTGITLTANSLGLQEITAGSNITVTLPSSPTFGMQFEIHNQTSAANGYTIQVQDASATAVGNPIFPTFGETAFYDGLGWVVH